VADFNKKQDGARPDLTRAFLSRFFQCRYPGLKAHLIFWSVVVLGVALDLWSKSAVFSWLSRQPDGRFSIIGGFFQLVRTENPGAAFGIAPGQRYLLVVISFIALAVIFAVFVCSGGRSKLFYITLGLFSAGVFGNLYDRIFNGGLVRDFIDIGCWPAFNVADSMLCIAVGLLIISTYIVPKQSR